MSWWHYLNNFARSLNDRTLQLLWGTGFATAVTVSMIPQTVGLNQYRKLSAFYKDGKEAPIDDNTKSLITKCLRRINMRPTEEADVDVYTTVYHDVLHVGSVKMRFGAIIGIPASFAYRHVDDIERASLLIAGRSVDWDSEIGKKLADSIILSDRAKAFAIARELKYVTTYHVNVDILQRVIIGMLTYWAGFALNQHFHLRRRLKLWGRITIYSFVGAAGLALYLSCIDAYNCWNDNYVDREVAALTQAYAEGGVEYYNKLLTRNVSLRSLMGPKDGSQAYTLFGNDASTWRRKHVLNTTRRDNLVRLSSEKKAAAASQSVTTEKATMEKN